MFRTTLLAFSAVFLIGVSTPSNIQAQAADPADVESIDAIIASLYGVISGPAGASRDWDRFRSLFRDDARLIPSGRNQAGVGGARYISADEYASMAAGPFEADGFFEVEIHRVEDQYGQIAHVFSTYESRRKPEDDPFDRGINSIQLLNDGSRWWIVNIFWLGETDDWPIPAKYLP